MPYCHHVLVRGKLLAQEALCRIIFYQRTQESSTAIKRKRYLYDSVEEGCCKLTKTVTLLSEFANYQRRRDDSEGEDAENQRSLEHSLNTVNNR